MGQKSWWFYNVPQFLYEFAEPKLFSLYIGWHIFGFACRSVVVSPFIAYLRCRKRRDLSSQLLLASCSEDVKYFDRVVSYDIGEGRGASQSMIVVQSMLFTVVVIMITKMLHVAPSVLGNLSVLASFTHADLNLFTVYRRFFLCHVAVICLLYTVMRYHLFHHSCISAGIAAESTSHCVMPSSFAGSLLLVHPIIACKI